MDCMRFPVPGHKIKAKNTDRGTDQGALFVEVVGGGTHYSTRASDCFTVAHSRPTRVLWHVPPTTLASNSRVSYFYSIMNI